MMARRDTLSPAVVDGLAADLQDPRASAIDAELLFVKDGSGTAAKCSHHSQDSAEAMAQLSAPVREFLDGLAGIIARDILRGRGC